MRFDAVFLEGLGKYKPKKLSIASETLESEDDVQESGWKRDVILRDFIGWFDSSISRNNPIKKHRWLKKPP